MARSETCEPNRLVSAAIGLAVPKDSNNYGYLSEHHSYGETGEKAGEYAEDLAATMLATTLGIEFDSEKAWEEREQVYKASGQFFKTLNIVQSAEGNKDGLWTTVLSAAVLLPEESTNGQVAQAITQQTSQSSNNQAIVQANQTLKINGAS